MYMAKNQEIGKLGEDTVVKHLQGLGWQILERNKMVPGGEIDIIAKEPKTKILVFIEVKTQASVSSGFKPEDQYRLRKRRTTERSCQWFAGHFPELIDEDAGWRIDLITAVLSGEDPQISHYKNA